MERFSFSVLLGNREEAFSVQRSAFNVQRSAFNVQRSAFTFQPSAYCSCGA
jgi:hypothetical protein